MEERLQKLLSARGVGSRRAMEECAADFTGSILLIDAVDGLRLPCQSRSIIKGDANSYMIAAASIVAKVTRDRLMVEMEEIYPGYDFKKHKGYGTAAHIQKKGRCGVRESNQAKSPCYTDTKPFCGRMGYQNHAGHCYSHRHG